jgi:hypothetical protein
MNKKINIPRLWMNKKRPMTEVVDELKETMPEVVHE